MGDCKQLCCLAVRYPDKQNYASEADEWADLIADNRIAEFAEIDSDVMAKLLTELYGLDFDMNLTGYSEKQIDNLLADIRTEQVRDDHFDAEAAAEEINRAYIEIRRCMAAWASSPDVW